VNKFSHYKTLAHLFEYPDAMFADRVRNVRARIAATHDIALEPLDRFIALLPENDLYVWQELFTRTFDVQAITTLDIGYVLFGDDYKRGELLSNLNREHIAHSIDCGVELADHLPNVLRLIAELPDEELLDELIEEIVAPALAKMISEFEDKRIEGKHRAYRKHYKTLLELPATATKVSTLYQYALHALYRIVKQDFAVVERIPVAEANDFLDSLGRENDIEEKAEAFY